VPGVLYREAMTSRLWSTYLLSLVLVIGGCDEEDDNDAGMATMDSGPGTDAGGTDGGGTDAGDDTDAGGDDAGPGDAGPGDAGPGGDCPALASRTEVTVSGELDTDTTWTCDNLYIVSGNLYVSAVLTVEPGTVVYGEAGGVATPPGALIVTTDGRLEASGTVDQPIVFTSEESEGSRSEGDWAGLIMLGTAPNANGRVPIEGTLESDDRNFFGVDDPTMADPAHDCGTLEYVRIEFTGFSLGGGTGNEIQGLTLGACGYDTTIDHVQVHVSDDDGIEIFGGTVDLSHIVLTGATDDSLDWDDGWTGRVQFLIVQQHASRGADEGVEGDSADDDDFTPPVVSPPATSPRIYNATFVGTDTAGVGNSGLLLKESTQLYLRNYVILGFAGGVIDIVGYGSAAAVVSDPPTITIRNGVLYEASFSGATLFHASGSETDTDDCPGGPAGCASGLLEADIFLAASQMNMNVNPMLVDPFNETAPDFTAMSGSPLLGMTGETPTEITYDPARPAFFDTTVTYIGAIDPSGTDWTAGWTSYPAD